jgi:hypothetical protein
MGTYAGKYTIPAGGNRSENITNPDGAFVEGDNLWFSYSTYLNADVPLNTTNWQVIGQWKNDGFGSPPMEMAISNGRFKATGGWGWPGTDTPTIPKLAERDLGVATTGIWDTWLYNIKFSSDPTVGTVNTWRNGVQVITDWKPIGGTLYPSKTSYWKLGYYRSTSINQSSTVVLDNAKYGTTKESVL